jgi:uncharacterized protein (DUF433 family)
MQQYRLLTTKGTAAGESHHRAKLTERQVSEVIHRHARGDSLAVVAAAYGVGKACVWKIVKGHRRGHPLVLRPTQKPVASPALERKAKAPEELPDDDLQHAALTATEIEVLLELHADGWSIARLAEHFAMTAEEVLAVVRASDPHEDEFAPRRVCSDPLPELPAREDDHEDRGHRVFQLLAHSLS